MSRRHASSSREQCRSPWFEALLATVREEAASEGDGNLDSRFTPALLYVNDADVYWCADERYSPEKTKW